MELTGGYFIVEGHNKANGFGSLQKKYYSGGETGVIKKFVPNKYMSTVEHIPNEHLTPANLARALREHSQHNRAGMYSAATLDGSKKWQKTKNNCPDLASALLTLDIEKEWHASNASSDSKVSNAALEQIVCGELSALFPNHPGLAYVARYSSSARIKTEVEELRIRIYVFLDRPIAEDERIERFAGLDTDDAVFERNCLDLITPGLVMDRGVDTYDIPHTEVIHCPGNRLPVDAYPRIHKRNRTAVGGGGGGVRTGLGAYHALIAAYQEKNKLPALKANSDELYAAIAAMAEQGLLENKRWSIHFWLMVECFRRDGDCYKAMEFILSHPAVLGTRRGIREILIVEQNVSKYFHQKWNGTPISKLFRTDEVLTLDSLDADENRATVAKFFSDLIQPFDNNRHGNIVVDAQGIGLGKTTATIGHFCTLYDDDRISICYRKSILLMQCKELGFSYYLDVPEYAAQEWGEDCDFSKWTEQAVKDTFLRDLDSPAVTIQSLQYLADKLTGKLNRTFGLLVIDEVERVLEQLWLPKALADNEMNVMQIQKRFEYLMQLAYSAHTVLVADADASAELTGWLVEYLSRSGKNKYLIENKEDWYSRKSFCKFDTKHEWLAGLRKMIDAGETVLIHTDLGDGEKDFTVLLETIKEYCGLGDDQILGLHDGKYGEPDVRPDMNAAVSKYRSTGYKHLLLSPIIQIGSSHTGYPFDRVMLYFHHGKAFGIDRFQTGFRDRKADWIGYYFKGSFAPTSHDEVSNAFEEHPDWEPSFASDMFKDLQNILTRRAKNMRENPAAAFETLLTEREGNRVDFHHPITRTDITLAREIWKEQSAQGAEAAVESMKQKIGLLHEFAALDYDSEDWSQPHILDDLADIDEEDLRAADRYLERGHYETARAMVDLMLMDPEIRAQSAKSEKLAYRIMQGELLDMVQRVWSVVLPPEVSVFKAMQKRGFLLHFHVEGTDEAKAFLDFVAANKQQLEVGALMELQGWKTSPHKIFEQAGVLLGCKVQVIDKTGGIDANGNKLAVVWRDLLYKRYLKEGLITSTQNKGLRKQKVLAEVRAKIHRHEELDELEWNFYCSIGRSIQLSPRSLTNLRLWIEIAGKTSNPHYQEWHDHFDTVCAA